MEALHPRPAWQGTDAAQALLSGHEPFMLSHRSNRDINRTLQESERSSVRYAEPAGRESNADSPSDTPHSSDLTDSDQDDGNAALPTQEAHRIPSFSESAGRNSRIAVATEPASTAAPSIPTASALESANDRVRVATPSTNVLQRHWQVNRMPKTPDIRDMIRTRTPAQTRKVSGARHHSHSASTPILSDFDDHAAPPPRKRRKRSSRKQSSKRHKGSSESDADSHKLDNYDAKWRAVLRLAKARAHIYLLTQDAFPSTKKFTQEVVECIYEACMELSACGKIPPIQFEPREEIPEIYVKKVYEDQSTFRGDIKRAGATIAENMLIRPAIDNVPRAEYKTKIKAAVKTLRSHSAFLHAVDTRGELVNFASPCLEHFITSYLFKDNRRLGNRFPADFEEIPITTIALFGAVLRNNIDEWKHGKYALREFTTARYLHVYKEIKKSAEEVAADPVHGHAFAELCRSWGGGSGLGWNSSDDDSDNDSIGVNLS